MSAFYYANHTIYYGDDKVAPAGTLIVDLNYHDVPRLIELGAVRPATDEEKAALLELPEFAPKAEPAPAPAPKTRAKKAEPAPAPEPEAPISDDIFDS